MLKVIAIDDEPIAVEIISGFINRSNLLELVGVFYNALEAFSFLEKTSVDLIFLDIRMPDISGIDFYKKLSVRTPVIFTTAYPDFAVEGFELDIIDYLLKPYSYERFERSINKLLLGIDRSQDLGKSKFINLKSGYDILRLNIYDITYVASYGNYARIFRNEGEVLANYTLKDILLLLGTDLFIQVHRSYLVNKNYIQKLTSSTVIISGCPIPVGDTFQDDLKNFVSVR